MEDIKNLASSHLLVYHTRNDALSQPTRYELQQDRLLIFPEKGSPREVLLSQVKRCSLQYSPTRPEPNRYLCRLELQNGATIVFLNRTYKGILDFQDTSAEYVAFVRALHQALFKYNPTCQFVGGVSPALYALGMLSLLFAGGVVVFVAIFLLVYGLAWIVLLKLLLMLYYTPAAIQWVKRNKTCIYDPLAIPSELLPETATK